MALYDTWDPATQELYDQFSSNEITGDSYPWKDNQGVQEVFAEGFTDTDVSPNMRHEAREDFQDFLDAFGQELSSEDWQAWREYMGYQ